MIRATLITGRRLGQRGVTFVELLIVMGLLSFFLLILATIFTTTVDIEGQSQGYSATVSDGRFIMARLDYDIARASAISTPGSLGSTTANLVMTIGGASYTYAVSGNNLQLTDASGSANLNSDGTTVSAVTFQELGNGGGKPAIRFSFTLTSTAKHGSGQDIHTFTSTVERR